MTLSRWQSTIVDAQGNIQPFAILTVLNEATQTPAQIYASDSEAQPLPVGVVVADEFGYAYFYARGGRYRIQSADLNIDWRHVALGSASGVDAIGLLPLYGRDSVVAPVSQSGGIPTGGIIQRGSNTSGEFVRWADGTQACFTNSIGALSAGEREWFFPASFAPGSTPTCLTSARTINDGIVVHFRPDASATSVSFLALRVTGGSPVFVGVNTNLLAIGRWYD